MYLMRNHDVWIYVRCANSDPCIAFDRLYDLIDEAAAVSYTHLAWREDTPLTAQEIMELDDYCAARHIELVPSLSTFGHM